MDSGFESSSVLDFFRYFQSVESFSSVLSTIILIRNYKNDLYFTPKSILLLQEWKDPEPTLTFSGEPLDVLGQFFSEYLCECSWWCD